MATRHTTEFRQEAVRIAQTCGLTRRQAASDTMPRGDLFALIQTHPT